VAPRLPAAEKAARDEDIVRGRASGYTVGTLATRYGLDERHVRRILREHRERQPPLTARFDHIEVAMDSLDQLDYVIEELAELADAANQEAVRLGAIRSKLTAMRDRWSLLQAVGLLPNDLGSLADEIDVRMMVEIVSQFLVEQEVPRDAVRQLVDRLDPGVAATNSSSRTG
jgi:hypothetical protein